MPSVSGKSAILMEQESGRVLFEKNAHEISRIASITKIMTAIIAIEYGQLDDIVTVSANAAGIEGSSLFLQPGQTISLEDLIYGLMLRSGNDAAVAIAEHVGGSIEGFVLLMNQKAELLGMSNTEFQNPHGLDDHEDHYSTAYDMALLTKYAMENETFRKISGTKRHKAENSMGKWDYVWNNKNKLVTGLYEYSTGGKTGYTKRAKRTLVSTASKHGIDLIAVTLNAPDDWNDHIQMFEWGFRNFELVELMKKGTMKQVKDEFYKNTAYVDRDFIYPLREEEKEHVALKIELIKPKETWRKEKNIPLVVGRVTIHLEDKKIGELPIYYKNQISVKEQSWFSMIQQFFKTMLGVK